MARRKPRLFAFSREIEVAWFDEWVSDPAVRKVLEDVVDAFAAVCATQQLPRQQLEPIANAAEHPDQAVRGFAVTRLSVLAHYFSSVNPVFEHLVAHPDPDVRRNACTALANAPPELAAALLDRALDDASWTVRKAAAQVSGAIPIDGLLEVIARHRRSERDARVRVLLDQAVDVQRR